MEKIKPRTLSGFMELLPQKQAQMERVMETLRETYALYGFYPLDTPVLESSDVLLAKGGGETEKQIYRFQKGDSDLAMRFDLTVPLAKYVSLNYGQLTSRSAVTRSARFTAANVHSADVSVNFIRQISTSSAMGSLILSTKPRFRPLSTRRSPSWVWSASKSA